MRLRRVSDRSHDWIRNSARQPSSPPATAAQAHGHSMRTRDHRPWKLLVALEFAHASAAGAFERYLKTGSGRAFAKRHFV